MVHALALDPDRGNKSRLLGLLSKYENWDFCYI